MFGDIMHGSILTIFAMSVCMRHIDGEKGLLSQSRYLLLLMGIFSTFCGFIYNEFTSLGTNTFGPSCYLKKDFEKTKEDKHIVWAHQSKNCVYPFGFDPVWFRA